MQPINPNLLIEMASLNHSIC